MAAGGDEEKTCLTLILFACEMLSSICLIWPQIVEHLSMLLLWNIVCRGSLRALLIFLLLPLALPRLLLLPILPRIKSMCVLDIITNYSLSVPSYLNDYFVIYFYKMKTSPLTTRHAGLPLYMYFFTYGVTVSRS